MKISPALQQLGIAVPVALRDAPLHSRRQLYLALRRLNLARSLFFQSTLHFFHHLVPPRLQCRLERVLQAFLVVQPLAQVPFFSFTIVFRESAVRTRPPTPCVSAPVTPAAPASARSHPRSAPAPFISVLSRTTLSSSSCPAVYYCCLSSLLTTAVWT